MYILKKRVSSVFMKKGAQIKLLTKAQPRAVNNRYAFTVPPPC